MINPESSTEGFTLTTGATLSRKLLTVKLCTQNKEQRKRIIKSSANSNIVGNVSSFTMTNKASLTLVEVESV